MELKKEQYDKIKDCYPKWRKPAKTSNLDVLNAVLYVVENGSKWRGLPKEYGDWCVIYVRRIKRFRRIFTRYDKLDVIFLAVVYFALIVDALI